VSAARALAVATLLGACQPTSQLIIHVDTDAVVPPRPGTPPDPSQPNWLFDRLRAELLDGGAPAGARDFELDEGLFLDGKMSFGVAPRVGDAGLTVRLRLYRGDHAIGGEPMPSATLDSTYALPALDSSSVVEVTARLATSDVGRTLGPVMPDAGPPGPTMISSWPGAAVIPCSGSAGAGEVCVPGGAFWMGDPIIKGFNEGTDADQERLVVISPFYIELHEVTVADVRANGAFVQTGAWNQMTDPSLYDTWCTYTDGPSPADPNDLHAALADTCINFEDATRYCQLVGKTLPSEAQYEFVASGRGLERAFPWGNDEPACSDAVWGLGGLGFAEFYESACRVDQSLNVVHAPGTGARDRVALVDAATGQPQEIVDLAGNLGEWVLDVFVDESDPFWSAPGVRTDPVYQQDWKFGADLYRSVRGGDWHDPPVSLRAGNRGSTLDTDAQGNTYDRNDIGLRCVRSAKP
jgi:formylglycine-generating enzyme required for sulfatase activity